MNTQKNKELVKEGYRLFQTGDIKGLLERYTDDAEWVAPESDILPFSGNFHGKRGIAEFFAKLDAAVQPLYFEVKDVIAEGDKVVVTGASRWRGKTTGTAYDNPWVHIFTIRDGKVARIELMYDTRPAERALGTLPGEQSASAHLHH